MHPLIKIIITFFSSSVKFLFGVASAEGFGFSFLKSVTIVSLGGFLGTIVCVYALDKLITVVNKIYKSQNRKPKKAFTRTNKFIVRAKQRFGLVGIAIITPLLSYPLGCYVAVRYYKDKGKILRYTFTSTLLWSIVIFSYKIFLA